MPGSGSQHSTAADGPLLGPSAPSDHESHYFSVQAGAEGTARKKLYKKRINTFFFFFSILNLFLDVIIIACLIVLKQSYMHGRQ